MLHQTQEIRTSSRLGMGSDFFFLSQVLWCDKQNERKETDRNHSDSCRKHFITLRFYKYFLNTRLYFSMIFVKEYFTQFEIENQRGNL